MSANRASRFLAAAVLLMSVGTGLAQPVSGTTGAGSGAGWQSSWLDLKSLMSFKKGEKLAIKVDGNAENVLVRFLPASGDPTTPVGVEGNTRKVPANRVLIVVLERDHPNIKQISVHAGTSAWGTPLGANNGTVSIVSIDHVIR